MTAEIWFWIALIGAFALLLVIGLLVVRGNPPPAPPTWTGDDEP